VRGVKKRKEKRRGRGGKEGGRAGRERVGQERRGKRETPYLSQNSIPVDMHAHTREQKYLTNTCEDLENISGVICLCPKKKKRKAPAQINGKNHCPDIIRTHHTYTQHMHT
jgi:hypothetical protein